MKKFALIGIFCIGALCAALETTELYDFLGHFKRTFTVLEIDPGAQPYAFSLIQDFHCIGVLLESQEYLELLRECIKLAPDNLIVLTGSRGLSEYQRLIECEHFDVVVVHNLSQILNRYSSFISFLFQCGDYTFISLQEDNTTLATVREYLAMQEITYRESDQWLMVHQPRTYLLRKSWDSAPESSKELYGIRSSFEKKEFIHQMRGTPTEWVPGINLATYVRLEGIYPMRGWVREKILKFKHVKHNDFWVGNIIMQGLNLRLIDLNDSRRNAKFRKHFNKVLELFD